MTSAAGKLRASLWLCAVLFVGLHVLLPFVAVPLSQTEPSFAGRVFPWLPVPNGETIDVVQKAAGPWGACGPFTLVCAGLFAVYAWMLRAMRGEQPAAVRRLVFIAGAVAMLGYVFSPVMFSSDIFAYAMYGRAMSVHGGNPYAATMPMPSTDPYYIQFGQDYLPSWYGPVWTFVSAGVTWFTGENLGVTVLAFRLVAIACALATSGLIVASLRRHAPENAARGLVLFLWNPLLVMETGFSGHNDSVMLVFVAAGVWLHLRGRKEWAVLALTLSALVKFLTGMLVPLYVLLVIREAATWRERAGFVLRSGIPACAVALALFHFSKADTDVPVAHSATSPAFYMNNFHEVIFRRLRVAVGEDAEGAKVPVYFYPHWVRLREGAELRREKSADSPVLRRAEAGGHLLVITPGTKGWMRAYDPVTRRAEWFMDAAVEESKRPPTADDDPAARELEKPVLEQRTVRTANAIVRIVTWLGFAAFGLFAAWRTRSFADFLVWSGASLIASYFFIITEIWPWYVNWALALGALAPSRLPARFAVLLSGGAFTLYLTLGLEGGQPEWLFPLRGVVAFVLPLAAFLALWCARWRTPASHVSTS